MPSTRRPLFDNGKWCVDAASHRQNNNYRHLETGASQTAKYQDMLLHRDQEGPFVFGVHGPTQFPARNRYEDSNNLCCDNEEGRAKIVKSVSIAKKDDKDDGKRLLKDRIKCVLVGDGAVGKTSLISTYAKNQFQHDYQPTAFDNYNVDVNVDGKTINLEICDTAGQDHLETLNEFCYPGTDVILLCFSVVKPESYRSIINRWAPVTSGIKAPLILVGTQSDLRDSQKIINNLRLHGENPISESEARALATKLNAPYIETSSKNRINSKEAFDAAILAALHVSKKKKSFWKKMCCMS